MDEKWKKQTQYVGSWSNRVMNNYSDFTELLVVIDCYKIVLWTFPQILLISIFSRLFLIINLRLKSTSYSSFSSGHDVL